MMIIISQIKDEAKKQNYQEDRSYNASTDNHRVGYQEKHHKHSSKHVSRNQDKSHHSRHQAQTHTSQSNEGIRYSTKDKLDMDSGVCPTKESTIRFGKKKSNLVSEGDETTYPSRDHGQVGCESGNGFALNNVCNNSIGVSNEISGWDEVRKSIYPEDAQIMPSAAFLEHDIIHGQRREIVLLMEELGTRDQELNDLVRSHQSQVKAWEADRNKLKELQQRLRNYEKELQQSDDQLQMTLDKMKEVTDQKEMDGVELKKTKGEMEKLSHKIQENSLYLEEMEIQNRNLMESVEKLVSAKEDLEMRGKKLTSRLKAKVGEVNVQGSEISRLTTENRALESKLQDANENMRNLRNESDAWKTRYCAAKDEADRLEGENKAKDGHIQNLTSQLHETLQQTLALQKALFTSCEREKCKEEIMNSLRKQQKRTMQEMSSLRKLYERQTKDMTYYHLSVQDVSDINGSKCQAGQREMTDACEKGIENKKGGHEAGRTIEKNQEHVQGNVSPRGRKTKRKHTIELNDKNMSYPSHKPCFLNYESKSESSSFLVKKMINTSGGQQSEERDQRKDVVHFDGSDLEGSDTGDKEFSPNESYRKGNNDSEESRDGTENSNIVAPNSQRPARMEKIERRSKSLGNEFRGRLKPSIHFTRQSCSRGTSPVNIKDTATSPIINPNSLTQSIETKVMNVDCNRNTSLNKKAEESKGFEDDVKGVSRTAWSAVKQTQHNETSGVCLSSTDCSSSTLSSPGQVRMFDELPPADSDGMCDELQRKFIPECRKSFHDELNLRRDSIHLRNSPAVIPEPKSDPTISKTKVYSKQRGGDNNYSMPNRNSVVGRTFLLVDEERVGDNTVKKEKWCDSTGTLQPSIEASLGGAKTKGTEGVIPFYHKDHRIDFNVGHGEYQVVSGGSGDTKSSYQVLNSHNFDQRLNSGNNNAHDILKGSSHDSESSHIPRTPFTNAENNHLHDQKSHHSPIHFGNTGTREKAVYDSSSLDTQSVTLDRRKPLETSIKSIRKTWPQKDSSRSNGSCDSWRKDITNHSSSHSQSEFSPPDSDTSDMSLYTTSTKSNHSVIKERLQNILARAEMSQSTNSSKSRLHALNSGGGLEVNTSGVGEGSKVGSMDRKQHYFYDENLSSGSQNDGSNTKNVNPQDDMKNDNAYIVSVSSSTCSRPFLSTKGPSLYNRLSTIHFSEKSRRYEWGPQSSAPDSEQKDLYQGSHKQGKSFFVTYPNGEIEDKHSNSDRDAFRESNSSNNNNSNPESFEKQVEVIDNICDIYDTDAAFHVHAPNNMDKFHHHYNNIVRKLSCSNMDVDVNDDDDNLERSLDNQQSKFPSVQGAPENFKRTTKRSEFNNIKSDESIFSPSQIRVKVFDLENNTAVEDNVVRRLDFSNSMCADQSNLDLIFPPSSHLTNILDINSEGKSVQKANESDLEKMNIPPLEVPETFYRFNPSPHDIKSTACPHAKGDGVRHVDDTVEVNEEFHNISSQYDNKPFWNICDDNEQIKFGTLKILSEVDGNGNTSVLLPETKPPSLSNDKQPEKEKDFELAASLPDYFPDISSVMADDDSVIVDRTDVSDFYDPVCKESTIKTDIAIDNDGHVTHDSNAKQVYGQTSTPTKVKSFPFISKGHTTNDLNSSHHEGGGNNTKHKTTISKELDVFGINNVPVNKDSDNSYDTNPFEIDCREGRLNENVKDRHLFKKVERDEQIIDCNDIVLLNIRENGDGKESVVHLLNTDLDKNSSDRNAGMERDQKVDQRLPDENIEKHENPTAKTLALPKQTHHSIGCHGDTNGGKEENSSYLEGPWDKFEDRLSNFLSDTPRNETSHDLSKVCQVPMSPASKLHYLLLESQEMIRSLERKKPLPT